MEIANIGSAIAEHADGHIVILKIMIAERQSSGDRQVATYDSVSTPEVFLSARHVHGATFTMGHAGRFTEQFCQHNIGRDSTVDGDAMVTIGCDHTVTRFTCRD